MTLEVMPPNNFDEDMVVRILASGFAMPRMPIFRQFILLPYLAHSISISEYHDEAAFFKAEPPTFSKAASRSSMDADDDVDTYSSTTSSMIMSAADEGVVPSASSASRPPKSRHLGATLSSPSRRPFSHPLAIGSPSHHATTMMLLHSDEIDVEDDDESEDGSSSSRERFYCDYPNCGKSFCRGYSLKYHKYTHTNDAPFACEVPPTFFGLSYDRAHTASSPAPRMRQALFASEPPEAPCIQPQPGRPVL